VVGCSGSSPGADRQWFAVYDPHSVANSPLTAPQAADAAGLLEYNNARRTGPQWGRPEWRVVDGEPLPVGAGGCCRSSQPRFSWSTAPELTGPVVATRTQASAQRSEKYCLPLRSNAMSVFAATGPGAGIPTIAEGGAFCASP